MELSKRLHAVASLVTEGAFVADIGTDHGYIPIWLATQGVCQKIIAMDIKEGPLSKAREHIRNYQLDAVIETRISDGLKALQPGEVHTAIVAGMGGGLVIKILEGERAVAASLQEFILQPQSEICKVRRYLVEQGYCVIAEDMVEEDGKYYPIMKAVWGVPDAYSEEEYLYGKKLLSQRHPVLRTYLEREQEIKNGVLRRLQTEHKTQLQERIQELEVQRNMVRRLLETW